MSRTPAQVFASDFQRACQPHQFALSTHSWPLPEPTRPAPFCRSMVPARMTQSPAPACCKGYNKSHMPTPACLWCGRPSEYVWHDQHNQPHTVTQAEGGEQGDLMPVLVSLAQRPALQAVQTQLQPGESLSAFLDDVYAVAPPHRVRTIYDLLAHHLFAAARIRLNSGKTRIWNQACEPPPHLASLGDGVWVGDRAIPAECQSITVLGAPLGTPAYIQAFLTDTLAKHIPLLHSIPALHDLQASWLLLVITASPRCNYLLSMLEVASICTTQHANLAWRIMTQQVASIRSYLAQRLLVSASDRFDLPAGNSRNQRQNTAVQVSCFLVRSVVPDVFTKAAVLHGTAGRRRFAANCPCPSTPAPGSSSPRPLLSGERSRGKFLGVVSRRLARMLHPTSTGSGGNTPPPSWEDSSWPAIPHPRGPPSPRMLTFDGPTQPGWQHTATTHLSRAARAALYESLPPADQALLDSQAGPYASRAFTTTPYGPDTTYAPHIFRVLLLRRLRLPLPLAERFCRCRRTLDTYGDHPAAYSGHVEAH